MQNGQSPQIDGIVIMMMRHMYETLGAMLQLVGASQEVSLTSSVSERVVSDAVVVPSEIVFPWPEDAGDELVILDVEFILESNDTVISEVVQPKPEAIIAKPEIEEKKEGMCLTCKEKFMQLATGESDRCVSCLLNQRGAQKVNDKEPVTTQNPSDKMGYCYNCDRDCKRSHLKPIEGERGIHCPACVSRYYETGPGSETAKAAAKQQSVEVVLVEPVQSEPVAVVVESAEMSKQTCDGCGQPANDLEEYEDDGFVRQVCRGNNTCFDRAFSDEAYEKFLYPEPEEQQKSASA